MEDRPDDEFFRQSRQELAHSLKRIDPNLISEVMESNLLPPTRHSFDDVVSGLAILMGSRAASTLTAMILGGERPLASIEAEASEDEPVPLEDSDAVRYLRSRYQQRLRRAFEWHRGEQDDWTHFHREVLWDPNRDEWTIESVIEKVDGTAVRIRASPDSTLRLAAQLVRSLSGVPEDELAGEDLDEFLEEVAALREQPPGETT